MVKQLTIPPDFTNKMWLCVEVRRCHDTIRHMTPHSVLMNDFDILFRYIIHVCVLKIVTVNRMLMWIDTTCDSTISTYYEYRLCYILLFHRDTQDIFTFIGDAVFMALSLNGQGCGQGAKGWLRKGPGPPSTGRWVWQSNFLGCHGRDFLDFGHRDGPCFFFWDCWPWCFGDEGLLIV